MHSLIVHVTVFKSNKISDFFLLRKGQKNKKNMIKTDKIWTRKLKPKTYIKFKVYSFKIIKK